MVKISASIPHDLFVLLKYKSFDEKRTIQSIVDDALRAYFAPAASADPPATIEDVQASVNNILASNNAVYINCTAQILEALENIANRRQQLTLG